MKTKSEERGVMGKKVALAWSGPRSARRNQNGVAGKVAWDESCD